MLSRPTAKKVCLGFWFFLSRDQAIAHLLDWLWYLIDTVRGTSTAVIKHQSQLLFLARSVIGSSEQRNKWQGPASGGKDAVYAGWELEPM
jgi:hypothetical protein